MRGTHPPFTATITSKGQMTIPAAIARRMDLHAGDKLYMDVTEDGSIVGSKVASDEHRRSQELREIKRRVRRGITDAELVKLISAFVSSGRVVKTEEEETRK